MATSAGAFQARFEFQRRGAVDDGYGNEVSGDWQAQFTLYARLKPLAGGEDVLAGRLAGVQTYRCVVRRSALTLQITTEWRAVDARRPARVLAVRSPPADFGEQGAELEFLVQEGVAA